MSENITYFDQILQRRTIQLQVPSRSDDAIPLKRRSFKIYRKVRKMFRTDNTIRPRRHNHDFSNRSTNHAQDTNTPIFRVDDYYDRKRRVFTDAIPNELYTETKYKKKTEIVTKTVSRRLMLQLENYCDKTTLHGLRYVGDPTLSLCERLFWFLSFGIAVSFAAYYISNIYAKWNQSPVIISFSPFDADLNSIPFPAITICNMNQAKRSEAEKIAANGTESQKKLLTDYCNSNNITNLTSLETDWSTMQSFLVMVGQSCTDMLHTCNWKSEKIDCEENFNNDLTDEGLCCSFNRMPPNTIYRNPKSLSFLNLTYPDSILDWNPEDGFLAKNTEETSNRIPRRPLGSGAHLGLTIMLDAQVDNYYCSSTSSVGFKIILSNPIETPKMADFGFLLSPGTEARFVINPSIREASPSIRHVSIEKRQCYFMNERKLQYYRYYTMANCVIECQSNYTYRQCGCIPYFLPQSRGTRVCGKQDNVCVAETKNDMELSYGKGVSCNCLPGCYEITYTLSNSYSTLYRAISGDVHDSEFTKNMAVLHFYFETTKFTKVIKTEVYDFTDFISNTGGLLGVFLGFSILSAVEAAYYFIVKSFCHVVQSKYKIRRGLQEHNYPYVP